MIFRALKANDRTITHVFYGTDEETATDATGSVTVTVAREDGTSLTGGTVVANNGATGNYNFSLTAVSHTSEYDVLKVTWSATVGGRAVSEVDYVHVVGGRYFAIPSLRAQRGLASTASYPATELLMARDIAESLIENFTRHAWVPSYDREVFDGDDCIAMHLSSLTARRLIKVTISGTTADTTGWTISQAGRVITDGETFSSLTYGGQNISIAYEHGELHVPPDLGRAAVLLARHMLLSDDSTIPDRARMVQSEWGLFHLDTASEECPTGLPEVDAVIRRYRKARPDWIVG